MTGVQIVHIFNTYMTLRGAYISQFLVHVLSIPETLTARFRLAAPPNEAAQVFDRLHY